MQMEIEQQRQQALAGLDIGMIQKIALFVQDQIVDEGVITFTIKMATSSRKITFTKQTSTPILEAIG